MRLFLVRHGESVANVAGLLVGSQDSALTSHGVLQARRLGSHLAARAPSTGPVAHIFSSDLQRAARTAQAILDAQAEAGGSSSTAATAQPPVNVAAAVVQVAEIRERDFGAAEGMKFGEAGALYAEAESTASMVARVNRFLDSHLDPVLQTAGPRAEPSASAVVVVAHGLILGVLLRRLLERHGAPGELARVFPDREALVSWRNTGYMEAFVVSGPPAPGASEVQLTVKALNCTDHLVGLRKTRGGIGSAAFDTKQTTMDSFFKPAAKK